MFGRKIFFLSLLFAFAVIGLICLSLSCGRKSNLGNSQGNADSGNLPGSIQTPINDNIPPIWPPINRSEPISIEDAIEEVVKFEPSDTENLDWSVFSKLKHELVRQLEEIAKERGISSFPVRRPSQSSRDDEIGITISDVFVIPGIDGTNEIVWNEVLKGDYDGSFEVGVADITPIAVNYLSTYGSGYGNGENEDSDKLLLLAKGTAISLVESDGATELGVPDITSIALNYRYEGPAGYDIWRVSIDSGTPERIPNQFNSDAPTVVRSQTPSQGEPSTFKFVDTLPSQPSSIRRTSDINEEGEGWSHGNYYYYIDPREPDENSPPAPPDAPKFNVHVTYSTPFHMRVGGTVILNVEVFGKVTPVSFGVNWGDGATESSQSSQRIVTFTHEYSKPGVFIPLIAVHATKNGSNHALYVLQEAPQIHIHPDIPFAPTGLSASSSASGVYLNWDLVGEPSPVDVYKIYYSLRRGESRPTLLGITSGNTFETSITELLSSGLSAFFKVTCERGGRESAFSNEIKWPPSSVAAPFLTILGTSNDTRVDLSWSAVSDTPDYTVVGYRVFKGASLGDSSPVLVSAPNPLPASQTSYTYVPGTDEDSLYFFVRTVADSDRTSGRSNEVPWAKQTPLPPENLSAQAGYKQLSVSWDPSPSSNLSGYRVYYGEKTDKSDQREFTASKDARTFTINNSAQNPVKNGTVYYLWVAAERLGSLSEQAGPVNATPFNTPPVAGFIVDKTSGSAPLTVNFNSSTGNPKSYDPDGKPLAYEWAWGDGTPNGTGANPSHTYTEDGEYTPSLTVTDEDGATDTYDGTPIIVGTGLPIAKANANPISGNAPLTVNFNATGSSDEDGQIVKYEWRFSASHSYQDFSPDGVTSYRYDNSGTYTATLRVTDNDGKEAYDSVQIRVNSSPTAVANANPTSGTNPLTVSFNANGSADPDGTIVKWEWDWTNDGTWDYTSTSSGDTQYTYSDHGDFTAKLRVTDNDGATATATRTINVNAPPVAVANADPTEGAAPLTVNFNASGSYDPDGSIAKYEWDWTNNGTYDWESNSSGSAQYTYNEPGEYTAKLRVTDNDGAQGTATVQILVSENQEWIHTWGGSDDEHAFAISVDSSGNVYVAGYTRSFGAGSEDAFLLKYSASGTLLWKKTWGGSSNDYANGVSVDSSGNVHVAGYTRSFGTGSDDALLLKYSASGTLLWKKTWGGSVSDEAYAVSVDSSGNVYVAGYTRSFGAGTDDALLLKYSASGTLLWKKTWGGSGVDIANAVSIDSSGNVYVAGYTFGFGAGSYDAFILKYSASGTLLWQKTWGGLNWEEANGVSIDSSGNVYVTGFTDSFGAGDYDALLLKYSVSGTLLWQKTWGGSNDDRAQAVSVDSSGNVYVAGYARSFPAGNRDAFLLKYSASGTLLWQNTWGDSVDDRAYAVSLDSSGSVYLAGSAVNSYGSWRTPSGTETTPSGTETTPSGTEITPGGTETTPNGTETTPIGVEDTGGGGDDALVMKLGPQ